MRVYWTLEARARLLEIQAYIAQDSPAAARVEIITLKYYRAPPSQRSAVSSRLRVHRLRTRYGLPITTSFERT